MSNFHYTLNKDVLFPEVGRGFIGSRFFTISVKLYIIKLREFRPFFALNDLKNYIY